MSAEWKFPTPRYHLLDIWLALGGDGPSFDLWLEDEPRRTPADAWSQLMGAIAGNITSLVGDTNPPAGDLLRLVLCAPTPEEER